MNSNIFEKRCWPNEWVVQVAKQMVMTLGMSPEIGQRLLGGQQGGGPFMGRALTANFYWKLPVSKIGPRKIGEDFGPI